APAPALPGELLGGRYQLVREIARGGMGRVYVAQDARLGRQVAVKLLSSREHDPESRRRFEQEARAAGSLDHPGILAVYDAGNHDGRPYLVAELLQGETLAERLRRGPLSLAAALDCAGQFARGLAAAHEKGIVHRDLKPGNLFLTADGRVKIL